MEEPRPAPAVPAANRRPRRVAPPVDDWDGDAPSAGPPGAALARRQDAAGVPRGFAEADAAIARGDYCTAAAGYEDALRSLDDKRLAASKPLKAAACNAHYNLACIRALASVGKDGPAAEAEPIDTDAAARSREDAFRHLRRAIDLGYADASHLCSDPDLVPLHDDTRWVEVVNRLAGK